MICQMGSLSDHDLPINLYEWEGRKSSSVAGLQRIFSRRVVVGYTPKRRRDQGRAPFSIHNN